MNGTENEDKKAGLGEALRAIRKERRWRLADLSAQTGLPVSTLSKIENNRLSLSYDKLVRLSQSLGVDIARLFSADATQAQQAATGRRSILRKDHGEPIVTRSYSHIYPAADLLNKRIVPIIADLRARTLQEFGDLIEHPGEEFAIVLEGACELHTRLYAPVRLEQGDSIYFDSKMGHAYLAAAPGRCRILSVCSAPEAEILEYFPAATPAETRAAASSIGADEAAPRARGRKRAGKGR